MSDLKSLFSWELINSRKGYGIKLLNELHVSDSIILEKPIFSYIHYYSKKLSLVCDYCFTNVGSFTENLNHTLKICGRSVTDELQDEINNLKDKFPELEGVNYIKCKCGFIFCSNQCFKDSDPFHSFLCNLMTEDEKECWKAFKRHALKTHENFIFAGLIYVQIIYDSINNKKLIKDWLDILSGFYHIPWHSMDGSDSKKDMAMESFNLLTNCLKRYKNVLINDNNVDELFSFDFFLQILGMMDLVCVDIEIQNPINDLLFNLKNDTHGRLLIESMSTELSMIYQIINANNNQLGLDDINETIQKKELYPETMGLGLFNYLSKMNHSCEPNLQIEYTKNNIAHIAPLVDVPRGEEATISYIDEKDSVENRQEKLYKVLYIY